MVCFDETSKQLLGDVRPPVKAKPGRVERYDTEYQRNGTRNLFMFCEPKGGWRHVEVTGRRTAVDFAHRMKWLVDQAYSATVIRLVLDNLNTHKLGSLYEAFGVGSASMARGAGIRTAAASAKYLVSPESASRLRDATRPRLRERRSASMRRSTWTRVGWKICLCGDYGETRTVNTPVHPLNLRHCPPGAYQHDHLVRSAGNLLLEVQGQDRVEKCSGSHPEERPSRH